ncbi:MAG: helical backbone metal receptor [Rubricoccaceae bacterium]
MHRFRPLLYLCTLSALSLAGCQSSAPPSDLHDDLDRPVTLSATPETVLPLAPNLTELVAAAAGVDRLTAVSQSDTHPPGVLDLPRFQSFPLDIERVVELQPDLVLASADVNPTDQADQLTGLGIPTYVFSFDELADIPRALRTLDTLLASSNGAAVAESMEQRIDAVQETVSGFGQPRVLLLAGDEDLYAFGRDTYASEMIRLAGGDNLTDTFPGARAQPGEELVLEMGPEVIFVLLGADYDPAQLLEKHPTFFSLPAVQNGRVYGIDPDLVSRPGPRVAEGLEQLAKRLHPSAFAAGTA